MFDLRKFRRYKIKRLYVCKVALATNKRISEYKTNMNWKEITPSTEILYSTIFPGYFINPLTRQVYVVENKLHFNTQNEFYIVKTFGNIANILDIPNEIYSRGNYFKLPELINMHEQLKSKIE